MENKKILLIEDDYLDVESVKRALKKLDIKYELHVAHNGVDGLALLTGDAEHEKGIVPDVILLDINMPKMNGLEFLRIIKNYSRLKNIKTFVITTSSEEYDKLSSQSLGVHGYLLKPLDFKREDSKELLEALKN